MKWCDTCEAYRGWGRNCPYDGSKMRFLTKKDKIRKKFVSMNDIRCPVCNGEINDKWFNFSSGNIVDFVAECWSGDTHVESERHMFRFQIEIPEVLLIHNKRKIKRKR